MKKGNKIPIYIIMRSPNQYLNYKTDAEVESIDKCRGSVVTFDDKLGARSSSQIDENFTRRRHESLDVYYINQSYFGLPRKSIRDNSDRIIQNRSEELRLHDKIGKQNFPFMRI